MVLLNLDDYLDNQDEENSNSSEDQDSELSTDPLENTFPARSYQLELFDYAKEKNSIMVLGTGSGKTFISILLIKELAESIRGKLSDGAKRTVFLVNTVPLVYQQAEAIKQHTGYSVGHYEGSMGVDIWSSEKWDEELNKHEVLVMVAQIFKDLVLHNIFSLDKVNLLIMDECHHATGKHPMREIMREYNKLKIIGMEVPRVMGLTACVIHKKCKPKDILKYMHDLEKVMDCVLITSRDQDTVKHYTTRPQEMIITCSSVSTTRFYQCTIDRLIAIKSHIFNKIDQYNKLIQPQLKKFVSKEIESIIDVSRDLGEFILSHAIKLQAEYLKEVEADTASELEVLHELGRQLEAVPLDQFHFNVDINQYVSGKVKRLLEILKQSDGKNIVSLIFVTRRNTAKLLCSLLLKLKDCNPEIDYLLPECVVGGTFNMKSDLKTKEEILKQKKTIDNFRKGLCNLIVSTSVLEEGIDVRKCNLVIRFNAPLNYRSYIQSLGRARALPSYFITLANEVEINDVLENRNCFRKIHDNLNSLCHDRELPSMVAARQDFISDELEPPFAPYGIPGPQINFNSAIQLLNRYCGTLPQDKFTKLTVTVVKWIKDEKYYARLSLPMNSKFRRTITSKPMDNFENAKKSAAFEMCKKMFELNIFNHNLLPKKSKAEAEENLSKYLSINVEQLDSGQPQPGTRKRKQIYKRSICKAFQKNTTTLFHLHRICFQHLESVKDELLIDTDGLSTQLGILCKEELNVAAFPLFSKKWGEVNVIIEHVKVVDCGSMMVLITNFHKTVSSLLYKLNLEIMNFDHCKAGHSVYIVPLTVMPKCDLDIMKLNSVAKLNVKKVEELTNQISLTNQSRNGFKFQEDAFKGGVVIPFYRELEIFYVISIANESPLSPFPTDKKKYSSYKDYMQKKYNIKVCNDDQPLIECKHFSKEFNYLEVTQPVNKTSASLHPKFVPELCMTLPIAATLFCQVLCMASVLHRINGLEIEQEIYQAVGYSCTSDIKWMFKNYSSLDYNWVKHTMENYMQTGCRNICIYLRAKKSMFINPGMILQALTPLHTKESFNLERLEILGDSYLKFSIGNYLFCKETDSHEGALTSERSNIVSNKTLYTLAKGRNLEEAFQGILLSPATATTFGYSVKEDVEEKLIQDNVAAEKWASYGKDKERDLEDASQKEVQESVQKDASENESTETNSAKRTKNKPCDEPFNPWTEQRVADKSLADSVEALIGVYLLMGGEKAANHFMAWLGLSFITEEVTVPETAIFKDLDSSQAYRSVNGIYKKHCLDRLEDLIQYKFKEKSFLVQAFTHPSFVNNRVTDCYQRLEFYGDAILDYFITGYIFNNYNNYNPGQLTDLRSHYVKNETLARIAVKFGMQKYLMHAAPKLSTTIDIFIRMIEDGEKEFNAEDETIENEDIELPKALGDIIESLIAAVYMDSGMSMEVIWSLIELLWKDEFEATKKDIPIDSVRELYEKCPGVQLSLDAPTEDEPAKCVVKMPGCKELIGTGKNQKTAKQAAAKLALNHIKSSKAGGPSL